MKESSDRLSNLPLSLIHRILSLLPLRDAVKITILSKCWEDVWTTVPCLNLISVVDYGFEDNPPPDMEDRIRAETEKFQNYVHCALVLWKGNKILKFTIDVHSLCDSLLVSDVNVWTRFAVNNKVEELEIISEVGRPRVPRCLNSCSSLRKLSIEGVNVQNIVSPSWNQLKSLSINVLYPSRISGDLINRMLLGSPKLEVFELKLYNNYENLNIRSKSLKMLKIENSYFINDEQSLDALSICCPNLETLQISGVFGKCLFTDISSLIDATLDFDYFNGAASLYELLGENLKQVLSTNRHVEKVTLSEFSVKVFGESHKKYLHSPIPNVKFLKLVLHRIRLGEMMDLLGIFPNVKMLVIEDHAFDVKPLEDMEFESNFFESFLLELKTVEISTNFYDVSIFGVIEFLLKHAVKLENIVLRSTMFEQHQQKKMFEISEELLRMQRASPTARVILKNG